MKYSIVVILLFLLAFGETSDQRESQKYISCPNLCLVSPLFGELTMQSRAHLSQFVKWYVDGESVEDVVPKLKSEQWEAICSMWKSFHLCIQHCGDESLSVTMQKWMSVLMTQAGVDFFCGKQIEDNFKCVLNVAQTSMPICDARCSQFRTIAADEVKSYRDRDRRGVAQTDGIHFHKMVTIFGKNVCQFINCHAKCRTNVIVANCGGRAAINASRQGLFSLGRIAEVAYFGYSLSTEANGRLPKFPPECIADQLVHGFDAVEGDAVEETKVFDGEDSGDDSTVHLEL